MKKIIFTLLILVIGGFNAINAQVSPIKIGLRGGVNIADWRGDAAESFSELAELSGVFKAQSLTGFHAGAYVDVPITERLTIEPGLYYSTKGMKISQTLVEESFLNIKGEITSRLHYIELPVLAKVNLTKGLHIFAGPQMAYLASNSVRAEAGILGFSVGENFNIDNGFRNIDFGLVGGLGYQLSNGINFRAGYEHGLSTLDEGTGQVNAFNRVVKFSLGYTF